MMQEKRVGGNLERALQSNESFKPMDVLAESWQLTKQNFASMLGALALAMLVYVAVALVLVQVFIETPSLEDPRTILLMQLLQSFLMPPLFAAVHIIGLRHSVGDKTRPTQVFDYLKQPFPFIAAAVMIQLLSLIVVSLLPALLGLLAMAFLSLTLSMVLPLIADYRLTPFNAIKVSFMASIRRVPALLAVYAILFVLFLLSVLTMGLLLIVVAPLFYHAKAVMYREIFGVCVEQNSVGHTGEPTSNNDSNSNTFSA